MFPSVPAGEDHDNIHLQYESSSCKLSKSFLPLEKKKKLNLLENKIENALKCIPKEREQC